MVVTAAVREDGFLCIDMAIKENLEIFLRSND